MTRRKPPISSAEGTHVPVDSVQPETGAEPVSAAAPVDEPAPATPTQDDVERARMERTAQYLKGPTAFTA